MTYETTVVGLDLSPTSTGWCSITYREPVGTTGVILEAKSRAVGNALPSAATPPQKAQRLLANRDDISFLLRDNPRPVLVVLEDYTYRIDRNTFVIAEFGGVIRAFLQERGYPFILVNPMHLKQYATGNHVAQKEVVRLGAYKRWGFEAATNDEVDAYVLAQIGLALTVQKAGFPVDCRPLNVNAAMLEILLKVQGIKPPKKPKRPKVTA